MSKKANQQAKTEEEEIPEIPFELVVPSGKTLPVKFPEDDLDLVLTKAKVTRKGKGEVTLEVTLRTLPEDVDPETDEPTELVEDTVTVTKFEKDEEELEYVFNTDMDPHFSVKGPGEVTISGVFTVLVDDEEEDEEESQKE